MIGSSHKSTVTKLALENLDEKGRNKEGEAQARGEQNPMSIGALQSSAIGERHVSNREAEARRAR